MFIVTEYAALSLELGESDIWSTFAAQTRFYYFLASSFFFSSTVSIKNSLDLDQDRRNVGLDLSPNCLTLC